MLEIKELERKDIPRIIEIFYSLSEDFNPLGISRLVEELENFFLSPNKPMQNYFVYYWDTEPVGLIGYKRLCPGSVEITWLAVKREFQRRGIGKRLVEYTENYVKSVLKDEILVVNTMKAGGFYEKCGFEPINEEKMSYRKKILKGRRIWRFAK
jgi:ribosomal protein S18 acetylase RimI-like enzyme